MGMVRTARILVVDDDPWIQRRVASTLGQRGHQVSLAGDAQGALAVAMKVRPDLIVTVASLPAIEGWSWWERLRASRAGADTPIIFLVSVLDPTGDVRGRTPTDQMLRKPFRVEDLENAVVTALGADLPEQTPTHSPTPTEAEPALPARPPRAVDPHKPSAGYRPLSAVRGAIDQISLASVLTLLEMERKTGLLLLERAQGGARLYLRKGRVIRADIENPLSTGAGAVYEALGWTDGTFDFLAGDVGGVDDIQTTTTFLLMEGARRADEARALEEAAAATPRRAGAEDRKL
jgi:CheY-like chemotaxis protein